MAKSQLTFYLLISILGSGSQAFAAVTDVCRVNLASDGSGLVVRDFDLKGGDTTNPVSDGFDAEAALNLLQSMDGKQCNVDWAQAAFVLNDDHFLKGRSKKFKSSFRDTLSQLASAKPHALMQSFSAQGCLDALDERNAEIHQLQYGGPYQSVLSSLYAEINQFKKLKGENSLRSTLPTCSYFSSGTDFFISAAPQVSWSYEIVNTSSFSDHELIGFLSSMDGTLCQVDWAQLKNFMPWAGDYDGSDQAAIQQFAAASTQHSASTHAQNCPGLAGLDGQIQSLLSRSIQSYRQNNVHEVQALSAALSNNGSSSGSAN